MVIVFFKAPTEQAESWQGQWHETNTPSADCNREKKNLGETRLSQGTNSRLAKVMDFQKVKKYYTQT